MMKLLSAAAVAALFCMSAISAQAQHAQAHHAHAQHSHASSRVYTLGSLKIERPWTRATPRSAPVAGGYLKITNNGAVADRLIGGSFDLAGKVEVHEMSDEGGMMRMRPHPLGLEIAPGQSVELRPGGFHLMFMDLKQGVVAGQNVKGALVFEKAGRIEVEFEAEAMGASAPAAEHQHEHKHKHKH